MKQTITKCLRKMRRKRLEKLLNRALKWTTTSLKLFLLLIKPKAPIILKDLGKVKMIIMDLKMLLLLRRKIPQKTSRKKKQNTTS